MRLVMRSSFDVIVRSLTRDDHIVYMALAQTGVRDPNKPGIRLQLRNRPATQVSHARAQPTHQLIDHSLQRPAMRNAPLNPLWNKLGQAIRAASLARRQRW